MSMFKKSFIVVGIQATGIILGFLSIYFIAGDMEPVMYSLVGVYNVLSTFLGSFTDLGIETAMSRQALYWEEKGETERIKEYASQALVSRVIGTCVFLPFLIGYVFYLCLIKYNGDYLNLLFLMLLGSTISSINNSMALIVRAKGGYIFWQAATTLNNYFLKFVGIGLYFASGPTAYLYFYSLSSIPLLFVFYLKIWKDIDTKYFVIRKIVRKIYDNRYLWLKTDLDYFKANADGLLVSALFPADIMGSYSLYKNFENISKSFIEGFFDVLTQSMVRFKGNAEKLKQLERKIKLARALCVVLALSAATVFMINEFFFVELLHLSRYEYIDLMILFVSIVSVAHLVGKYEINMIGFFAPSRTIFKLSVWLFVATVLSYLILVLQRNIMGVLYQRVFVFLINSIISIAAFYRRREDYFSNIYS